MSKYSLNIGHIFPDLLNLYGDRGNIAALLNRMKWRGHDVLLTEHEKDDDINLSCLDIVFLGGGSDREQLLVCNKLMSMKDEIKEFVESGGVLIAVCGGYQLLGNYYKLKDETIEGLGILDIYTETGSRRLIGNVVIETMLTGEKLKVVGFENHGGRTYLQGQKMFGKVLIGNGNNGEDRTCGAVYKNVLGTYLHGPLLPKNPKLTDHILSVAIERKYGEKPNLAPLCDTLENEANEYIIKRFLN